MGNEISSDSSGNTITKRLQFYARTCPDKDLFVFYNNSGDQRDPYTAQQLVQLAGKFAHRLHQHGFQKGDVIVNTLPNSPERLIMDLGIVLAGCIAMNGQLLLSDGSDFFGSAKVSRCKSIIMIPDDTTPSWKLFKTFVTGNKSSFLTDLSCPQTPDMTSAILVSRLPIGDKTPLLEDLKTSEEKTFCEDCEPDDIFIVSTTSGSTGYSKLVPRSHQEFIFIVETFSQQLASQMPSGSLEDGPLYNERPLGWIGGNPYQTLLNGGKRVLIDALATHESTDVTPTWDIMCREKCGSSILLPPEVNSVLTQVDNQGGTKYKLPMLLTGGQPITKDLIKRTSPIAERILVAYGSTEAVPLSWVFVDDEDEVKDYYCGKVFLEDSVKILKEDGQECKPMETCIVHAKGPQVFKGYFNRIENPDPQTVKAFKPDGWFSMGDIGSMDQDGKMYVMGRQNDAIMYGPAILYPGWLERKIAESPDVETAFVVPVSDPVLFHNICACVKPTTGSDLTEDKLRSYCESIFIDDVSNELTPMPKFFMILQEFPKTYTGKEDRKRIKEMAEEKFGYKQDDISS